MSPAIVEALAAAEATQTLLVESLELAGRLPSSSEAGQLRVILASELAGVARLVDWLRGRRNARVGAAAAKGLARIKADLDALVRLARSDISALQLVLILDKARK